jgi:hypothetical protein
MNVKEIAEKIERKCKSDLDKIAAVLGAPRAVNVKAFLTARMVVIFMAIRAAERRLDCFTPEMKKHFRDRAADAKEAAAVLDTKRKKLRSFVGVSEVLDGPAESLREYSKNLNKYLIEHGRVDHDQAIPILIRSILTWSILTYKPQFDCWKALSHVIEEAYIAAGRGEEAKHISADKLSREARQCRERMNHEFFTNAVDSECDSNTEASHASGPRAKVVHG